MPRPQQAENFQMLIKWQGFQGLHQFYSVRRGRVRNTNQNRETGHYMEYSTF